MQISRQRILVGLITCIVISAGAYVIHGIARAACEHAYEFVHAATVCNDKPVIAKHGYSDSRARLQREIDARIEKGDITSAALFFRDLERGPTFGINEYHKVAPSGLMRLVMYMTYMNYSLEHPDVLDTKLSYDPAQVIAEENQAFPPSRTIEIYTEYRVEELLERTIVDRDNRAHAVLMRYLNDLGDANALLREEAENLGIIASNVGSVEEAISVKAFLSVFHTLYYSRMFPPSMSEHVLDLLSSTGFDNGLVAGVPHGMRVAHRFGERIAVVGGEKQLYDCGIVYYPGNPYSVCIMVKGSDYGVLADTIRTISKMVYDEVESRRID